MNNDNPNDANGAAANNGASRSVARPRTPGGDTDGNTTSNLAGLIREAEELKNSLRDILGRSHQLVAGLKRHRKQSQLVQASLKALQELQTLAQKKGVDLPQQPDREHQKTMQDLQKLSGKDFDQKYIKEV